MVYDKYAQGFSIMAISKKTGFNRRTVSKYLNNTSIPESKKRIKKASKLDEYEEYIITKLHEGPYTALSRRFIFTDCMIDYLAVTTQIAIILSLTRRKAAAQRFLSRYLVFIGVEI